MSQSHHDLPIFVINLDKSPDRLALISQQLNQQKLTFQRFAAIYGKDSPNHQVMQNYNLNKRLKVKGYPLNLGQLGCYASHYDLWKICVELNKPILIIEDDAILADDFTDKYHALIEFIQQDPNYFELLYLHGNITKNNPKILRKSLKIGGSKLNFYHYYKSIICTVSYIITPQGAKRLLNASNEIIYPVDDFMLRYYEHHLNFKVLVPAIVKPAEDLSSTIDLDAKRKRSFAAKFINDIYNLTDKIKRKIYNLTTKI